MTNGTGTMNDTAAEKANADGKKLKMPSLWASRLASLTLGHSRRMGGLTLYPLLGEQDGLLDYCTLDEALSEGLLTIGEIGASGTVPELELKNSGSRRVLLVDGEELIGAKQNRIVNTSVLVEAGGSLMLPVSCVEAGRWHAQSASFRSSAAHYNARGRQKKVSEVSASLADEGRPRADQGRVWADVDAKLQFLAVSSETRALSAVAEARGTDLEEFRRKLGTPEAREVGAVYALGRDIVGLDLFDQASSQAALLPKLVTSYALDAIEERPVAASPPGTVVARWIVSGRLRVSPVRALGSEMTSASVHQTFPARPWCLMAQSFTCPPSVRRGKEGQPLPVWRGPQCAAGSENVWLLISDDPDRSCS